jgi:hypothetical protein
MMAFRKSPEPTTPVSFRLPASLKKELAERAAAQGLSPGEYARNVVIESIRNDFQSRVITVLDLILRTTQAARNDIETAALGVLITAGNQPVEVAEEWLKANLRTEI